MAPSRPKLPAPTVLRHGNAQPEPFFGDAVPAAFVVVGPTGRVVGSNPRARALLADAGTATPETPWETLLAREDGPRFAAWLGDLAPLAAAEGEFSFGAGARTVALQVQLLRLPEGFSCTLRPAGPKPVAAPLFLGPAALLVPAALLSKLSHDLKTHLAAAQAASFLLRKHGNDLPGAKEQKWLAAIAQSLGGSVALLDQMDVLESTVAGTIVQTPEPTEIALWLERLAEHATRTAPGSTVTLTSQGGVAGRWWLCTSFVGTALDCLLSNALKFAPPGSKASVRTTATADGLEIVVADQGTGVADHEVGQLFNPFFQGANARNRPGRGRGLAIARAAMTRLGGTVSYRLAEGRGVEFCLNFAAKSEW